MSKQLEEFIAEVGDERYVLGDIPLTTDWREVVSLVAKKNATYFPGGVIQCQPNKYRSLIDVVRTALSYTDTPVENIVSYIAQELKNKKFCSLFCPHIKRRTIYYDLCGGYEDGFYIHDVPGEDDDVEEYMGYQDKHYHLLKSFQ